MVALPVVPLWERVVEIILDLGPGPAGRYRYGSGTRLGGWLVMTAAQVVVGAAAGITVRGPDKASHPARVRRVYRLDGARVAELAQRAAYLRDDHPPFRRRDGEDAALSTLPCAGLFEFSNTIIAMMHVAW